ncbi:MAG: sulfite exporter TauE/SafE family protein [Betaproteobacteria bacterium]|nr:sulfite exporter TauE/SafE family protein [Betaproteobacteria bacterium]MDH4326195.1 sulfite exporter TauE/SafE family protein [Betaproteobacteria bacterium]MDH5212568.1 sulfite exporter TauE/SafE family protein [Betaproteobacteria bacterium]
MDDAILLVLAGAMLLAAFVYASVGHGGASAYIAAMALAGLAPTEMRPIALTLNVLVSSLATWKFWRAGHFRWRLFWPFAAVSIPFAYLGGAITLPGQIYKVVVGLVLVYAGWQLWRSFRAGDEMRAVRDPAIPLAMAIGAAMGLLAGLTGVGGGIFLSPLVLMLGWAGTKQTSAVAAPFILVNSLAGLAAGFVAGTAVLPQATWVLAAVVVVGGWLGAEYGSRRFANPVVRRVLAVVLGVAGAKMVLA